MFFRVEHLTDKAFCCARSEAGTAKRKFLFGSVEAQSVIKGSFRLGSPSIQTEQHASWILLKVY
jgi:hypothetical protein